MSLARRAAPPEESRDRLEMACHAPRAENRSPALPESQPAGRRFAEEIAKATGYDSLGSAWIERNQIAEITSLPKPLRDRLRLLFGTRSRATSESARHTPPTRTGARICSQRGPHGGPPDRRGARRSSKLGFPTGRATSCTRSTSLRSSMLGLKPRGPRRFIDHCEDVQVNGAGAGVGPGGWRCRIGDGRPSPAALARGTREIAPSSSPSAYPGSRPKDGSSR